ncbi:hypothetical protein LZ32DRAFT_381013 [Colletotrichum eremochloae]|nr:hypothetical protein LZ32DRAFT_381013 [Colletotrichum eremochloae]
MDICPVSLVDRCDQNGPAENRPDQTRSTASRNPKAMRASQEVEPRALDWLPFAPSVSKQDNNAPCPRRNQTHYTMQSLSIPNLTPPCAMTSSVQVVGFFQIPGPIPKYGGHVLPAWHAVVCTCPPPQPICRLFPSFGGARICSQVSPRIALPYHWVSRTLYQKHCSKDRTRRPFFLAMSWCLDGARKAMLFAQASSPCAEPHRLESILHACPCVIHWLTPVSQRMSWDLHSRAPDTAVLYRPRVSVHINPPVGPLFARQCDGEKIRIKIHDGSSQKPYLVVPLKRQVAE